MVGSAPLDRGPRLKNRILSRLQTPVLDCFGIVSRHTAMDRLMARADCIPTFF